MSENGGRGRWLSPAEVVEMGLADAIEGNEMVESAPAEHNHDSKMGVKALLRALGIGQDDAPDVCDDINYIPHDAVPGVSTIAFGEWQAKVSRTKLKEVEDPDLREAPRDERKRAYDSDAKAMRSR